MYNGGNSSFFIIFEGKFRNDSGAISDVNVLGWFGANMEVQQKNGHKVKVKPHLFPLVTAFAVYRHLIRSN